MMISEAHWDEAHRAAQRREHIGACRAPPEGHAAKTLADSEYLRTT